MIWFRLALLVVASVFLLAPGVDPCRACDYEEGVLAAERSVGVSVEPGGAADLMATVTGSGSLVATVIADDGRRLCSLATTRGAATCAFAVGDLEAATVVVENVGRTASAWSVEIGPQ